jgi:anthranilate synthase/aminodeoxychorismate synthase-like glutamine amidotransferase
MEHARKSPIKNRKSKIPLILLIDNYDSFVHNLARYFQRLGQQTLVVRNDAITVEQVCEMKPRAIVLSPGPCSPGEAGRSVELVQRLWTEIPILGVCLGHQAIAAAFGATIVRAREPMHGRTSEVFHDGCGVFAGVPDPLVVCRYHSLIVDEATLPECLQVTARTLDGVVMALRHRQRPIVGVQFHPESILTEFGYPLLANFLRLAGISLPIDVPSIDDEREATVDTTAPLPGVPVTF